MTGRSFAILLPEAETVYMLLGRKQPCSFAMKTFVQQDKLLMK